MNASFKIWRGDANGGGFREYATEISEGMVVLDAIHSIMLYENQNGEITLPPLAEQVRDAHAAALRHVLESMERKGSPYWALKNLCGRMKPSVPCFLSRLSPFSTKTTYMS